MASPRPNEPKSKRVAACGASSPHPGPGAEIARFTARANLGIPSQKAPRLTSKPSAAIRLSASYPYLFYQGQRLLRGMQSEMELSAHRTNTPCSTSSGNSLDYGVKIA
jgi:hypothetical protein